MQLLRFFLESVLELTPSLCRFVQTDLGNIGARAFGLTEAETPMEESVDGLVKVIDGATREKTSGRFVTFEGVEFPW